MKKAVLVMLLSFIMVSMVFATGSTETKAQDVELGSQPVTIKFWHCASEEAGVLVDKYIKEFNETNKYQITVDAVYQGQYSDATTLVKTILSAENYKELPDMMQLDATGKVDYYNSGKAFTINDAVKEFNDDIINQYLEGALGNWQFNGVQLGLPFATSTTITFYNADMLEKAGWDHCPDTFADVIQLAADMKKAGITAAPFGTVPNTPTLANWLGQLGSYVVNFNNGSDASATKLECIDNGALKKFLSAWKEMYDKGGVVNQSLSTNQFINEDVAIFTSSSANIQAIETKVNGKFKVGVSTMLRVNSESNYGATVSGSCLVMFDSQDSLKKKATWEFMKFMTGKDVQTDFGIGTGYIPSNKASAETDEFKSLLAKNPAFGVGIDQLAKTPASMRSVTVGPSTDFYYAIMSGVSDMLTKNMSVEETVAIMSSSLQALLDQYARNNQ
ncbi:MAG: extracellular solute-binding protein [Sphaerochaetaceae bacterium]|nr:extracellular solute-binding protein [Sphaerochaetaceae bacterium]